MAMVTNERKVKDVMKHADIDGISEPLRGNKLTPTPLPKTHTLLLEKRNQTLDIVKIIARDADQANSAKNIIKGLCFSLYIISEYVASYYFNRNNMSPTEEELGRVDNIIFNTVLGKQTSIKGGSDGFQESDMVHMLKDVVTIGGITPEEIKEEVLITIGGDSYNALTRSEISMANVLPYLDSLHENINSLENLK